MLTNNIFTIALGHITVSRYVCLWELAEKRALWEGQTCEMGDTIQFSDFDCKSHALRCLVPGLSLSDVFNVLNVHLIEIVFVK